MSDPFPQLFGFVLFDGLDGWHILLLAAVYFFSYFIKGAIGVGNLALMVLLGALILQPHHAVVLAVTVTCFAQLQFMREGARHADWTIAKSVILGTYIGMAIGVWIFTKLDGTWLTFSLGSILGLLIIADMTRGLAFVINKLNLRSKIALYPTMICFGLISGVGGAGTLSGIAFYIKQISPDARILRGTIIMLGIIFALWRITLLTIAGLMKWNIVIEAIILIPFMLVFGYFGAKFFNQLSDKRYHQYLQFMLLGISVILVAKGLIGIFSGS